MWNFKNCLKPSCDPLLGPCASRPGNHWFNSWHTGVDACASRGFLWAGEKAVAWAIPSWEGNEGPALSLVEAGRWGPTVKAPLEHQAMLLLGARCGWPDAIRQNPKSKNDGSRSNPQCPSSNRCAHFRGSRPQSLCSHVDKCMRTRVHIPAPSLLAVTLGLSFPIWNNSHVTAWCEDYWANPCQPEGTAYRKSSVNIRDHYWCCFYYHDSL